MSFAIVQPRNYCEKPKMDRRSTNSYLEGEEIGAELPIAITFAVDHDTSLSTDSSIQNTARLVFRHKKARAGSNRSRSGADKKWCCFRRAYSGVVPYRSLLRWNLALPEALAREGRRFQIVAEGRVPQRVELDRVEFD